MDYPERLERVAADLRIDFLCILVLRSAGVREKTKSTRA